MDFKMEIVSKKEMTKLNINIKWKNVRWNNEWQLVVSLKLSVNDEGNEYGIAIHDYMSSEEDLDKAQMDLYMANSYEEISEPIIIDIIELLINKSWKGTSDIKLYRDKLVLNNLHAMTYEDYKEKIGNYYGSVAHVVLNRIRQ